MCKSANLHLYEKIGYLEKHATEVIYSTRVSGEQIQVFFLWGGAHYTLIEFKFSCSCPKTFQFWKDELQTQKLSTYYLWFSILVVNSVA